MISKISWRNVWRNKLRSSVVITSIILGIWAGLFVLGLSAGLNDQRIESAISNTLSHIQIHNPEFLKDNNISFFIPSIGDLKTYLSEFQEVKAFSVRTILNGMASSTAGGYGVKINGINPEMEKTVTTLYKKIIGGKYFEGVKKNPVVIGERLAKKLKAKVRTKIVLTFQNQNGDLVAGAYRVAGIYKTVSSRYDEANVFINQHDVYSLLGNNEAVHEIAVLANDIDQIPAIKEKLNDQYQGLSIKSWDEISPELGYANEMMEQMMYIFIGVIMLALAFGIINTMLMAVLERKRELGMLMSVGMNKSKVFTMIVLETVYLSMAGGPPGILLGYLTIKYFGKAGIDLSVVGEGLESLGIGVVVYPALENVFYINIAVMVVVTAILSSIYPAIKALKLKPAEAVRAL